jgi:hypothetical protein
MREPSELQRLNAAARAETNEGCTFLSLVVGLLLVMLCGGALFLRYRIGSDGGFRL